MDCPPFLGAVGICRCFPAVPAPIGADSRWTNDSRNSRRVEMRSAVRAMFRPLMRFIGSCCGRWSQLGHYALHSSLLSIASLPEGVREKNFFRPCAPERTCTHPLSTKVPRTRDSSSRRTLVLPAATPSEAAVAVRAT